MKQKTVFITGTDTGVGKSIFSVLLALKHLKEGKKIAISKPIQTGSPKDTDFLKELTGDKIPIFNTYSFSLGAAPSVASVQEDKVIEIEKIISDIRKLEKEFDHVIVEGIGGIAVPIVQNVILRDSEESNNVKRSFVTNVPQDDTYLVADLIKDLNYPVIIVARSSLGTINHTVLTIEFAKQKGLNILGFVVSSYDKDTSDTVVKTAPETISNITGVNCLFKTPFIRDINYDSLVTSVEFSSSNAPSCLANV